MRCSGYSAPLLSRVFSPNSTVWRIRSLPVDWSSAWEVKPPSKTVAWTSKQTPVLDKVFLAPDMLRILTNSKKNSSAHVALIEEDERIINDATNTGKTMKWLALLPLTLATAAYAAEPKPNADTFLDPAKAGQDYLDQGEYKNDWGGSQVIALGAGNFRMVTYRGGLPGDGWDKEFKQETPGKREGNKILFSGEDSYRAELANGKITINTADGGPYTMEKTERKSPTLGAKPPTGAAVLFDGTSADAWPGGHMDEHHLLAAGCKTKQSFNDFKTHLEFLLPFQPLARGQGRGNSGVYLQDRYELQVLDSFGLKGENDECGGFYSLTKPSENLCYPPLTWQTYDIDFTAAKFDDTGKKSKNAVVTIKHNGVTIHDNLELKGPTPGGKKEDASGGPLQLQGHGNPVFYRNVWVVEK